MRDKMSNNRETYGDALVEVGAQYSDVVALEADLGKGTQSVRFKERFPDRYFPIGIAEGNMMGIAAGLSTTGLIPFASTFCVFASMRAIEQVRNSIAYPKLNVKIVATNAGIEIGPDGATHQAIEDIAIMRAIPNMSVFVPSDAVVVNKIIHLIAGTSGPVYVRIGRNDSPILYEESEVEVKLGGSVVVRPGDDVTLMAVGNMVSRALDAADLLAKEGISARVIDMYCVKPIDSRTIAAAAQETGCIVTAEDHNIIGGLGGAVAEILAAEYPAPLERVGVLDVFAESGKSEDLLQAYGLTAERIAKAAQRAIDRRKG